MTTILFVGCGKMGQALLWGAAKEAKKIIVVKPNPPSKAIDYPNVSFVSDPNQIDPSFMPDAVVLTVKPQTMAAVLPLYKRYSASVFLSIAAGQTLQRLARLLENDAQAIVRAMPNLPASIGKGMTVAVATLFTTERQRALCHTILNAVGNVAWVEKEELINPITALSGSGPAYVFALAEAMAQAGEKLGIPKELAQTLARQTVIGSGALMDQSTESVEQLRHAVTSKGGTTEAALIPLLGENGLAQLMLKAMESAMVRAQELSN